MYLQSFSKRDTLSRLRRVISRLPSVFGRASAMAMPLLVARLLSKMERPANGAIAHSRRSSPIRLLCVRSSPFEAAMSQQASNSTNLELLERYSRRSPFHDKSIEVVVALNKRVVIRLTDMTLIVTRATDLGRCELPDVWLHGSIVPKGGGFSLDVETDTGRLQVTGRDVRLIRNSDLAMLIPPIDG